MKVLHYKTGVSGKVPTPENITYGEIAINYCSGSESFYIKNSHDEIVGLQFNDSSTFMGVAVVNQTESNVEIQPNVFNKWGEMSSLTITLATPSSTNIMNEYMIEFISGNNPTSLTLPSNLIYVNGTAPTIEANKTYQISILNNAAIIVAFS